MHPVFLIVSMMASFCPSIIGLVVHRIYLGKKDFRQDMKKRLSLKFSKWWLLGIPVYSFAAALISYRRVISKKVLCGASFRGGYLKVSKTTTDV